MASYNELNALIDAYINRNGVQAITGQILNGVLKAMVDQLGRGFTIMGAAQPNDNPGTPDGPESWFASTPGTYTNFGGLTVATAELALLSYTPTDGWYKETLTQGIESAEASVDNQVGTPSVEADYINGVLTFTFHNLKGNTGDAAGFGTVAATVDANIGTPAVSVQTSGPDTAKNMTFAFRNLKGETGVTSVIATVDNTVGTPACSVSLVGQVLHLDFTGLKGAQGDTGSSVAYPFTIVNNLTTDDATQALSAAMGVQLEGEITQLELKVDKIAIHITTTGKYVKLDGGIGTTVPSPTSAGSYCYSRYPVTPGNTVIVNGTGGSAPRLWGFIDAENKILSVAGANVTGTDLVLVVPTNAAEIIINSTNGGYGVSYYWLQASVTKQIADLKSDVDWKTEGTKKTNPSVTETSGKYIGSSGAVGTTSGGGYTSKFYVQKGKKIVVKARGYLTSVAMISKVVTEDSEYVPKVISTDSSVHTYEYLAEESGYYACSYFTSEPRTISILENTPSTFAFKILEVEQYGGEITLLDNRVTALENKTDGASITTLSLSETDGKYITSSGAVGTSGGFAYTEKFYAEKGQKIKVVARGYSTAIAMISKVITEGDSYTPKVICLDSEVRTYEYLVEESGYYAASFGTSQPRTIQVISNTPNTLSERINKNGERIDTIEQSLSTELRKDLYQGVPVVGMIGDSLMSGAGYDPNTGTVHDNIQFAWWRTLERKSGMTYRRFCRGGMSTFAFVSDTTYGLPVALTAGNECNLYIVGLEVNDRNNYPNDLGTASDIDLNNPDNNANTFYGNYGKIIQKITSFNPGCKFILFTNPRSDSNWNDAIREISEMFSNCYLVDLFAMYNQYYAGDGFFNRYKDSSAHYPAMAYTAMAKLLEAAIDKCINDNYTDFRDIQYQG